MTQCCGTCDLGVEEFPLGCQEIGCRAPKPDSILGGRVSMSPDEGTTCPCYKPKEDEHEA